MPIFHFVCIPPNTLDKIFGGFSNLERSLKFKMLPEEGGVFMYKDENLKVLYMEKNNR
jgi:hypothetical protein